MENLLKNRRSLRGYLLECQALQISLTKFYFAFRQENFLNNRPTYFRRKDLHHLHKNNKPIEQPNC